MNRPVTILRRGKPEAVLISYEEFERKLSTRSRPWRLEGSLRVKAGVDIDAAIEEGRREMRDALEGSLLVFVSDTHPFLSPRSTAGSTRRSVRSGVRERRYCLMAIPTISKCPPRSKGPEPRNARAGKLLLK